MRKITLALALLISVAASAQTYRSEEHAFRVVKVVEGLDHPWSMAFLPDGRMLVTERPGRLRIVANGKLEPQPVAGVPQVFARGQGGLFDVVLHPDFATNGLLYLSYAAYGEGGAGTELARAKLSGNRLENLQVLFRAEPKVRGGAHFGGQIGRAHV